MEGRGRAAMRPRLLRPILPTMTAAPITSAGRFSPRGPLGILVVARLGPRGLGGHGGIVRLRFLPCIGCHSRGFTGPGQRYCPKRIAVLWGVVNDEADSRHGGVLSHDAY